MLLGANTPYDWAPERVDETIRLLHVLGAQQMTIASHIPNNILTKLLDEFPDAAIHMRVKGNLKWLPRDLYDIEWPNEPSPVETIRTITGRQRRVHVLLWNEVDIEWTHDWQADNQDERNLAWSMYMLLAADAIKVLRNNDFSPYIKISLAPLSQGAPERFSWWADKYRTSGLLSACDFVAEHCYTDGRPFDDPDWGGRHTQWANMPVHITETNDNNTCGNSDLAGYVAHLNTLPNVECVSLFRVAGDKNDSAAPWWQIPEPVLLACRQALTPPPPAIVVTPLPPLPDTIAQSYAGMWAEWVASGGDGTIEAFRTHALALGAPDPAPPVPVSHYSIDDVFRATGCPYDNITIQWPAVVNALAERGILTPLVEAAAIATIRVEAPPFWPVKEYGSDSPYHPAYMDGYDGGVLYCGRGLLQLTHIYNYRTYGNALGVDLVGNPGLALDTSISARVLALFFLWRGVAGAAEAANWYEVRRLVNGGYNGMSLLLNVLNRLL